MQTGITQTLSARMIPGEFLYPDELHTRNTNPFPGRRGYSHYSAALATEFGFRCVYCRLPDGLSEVRFQTDHWKPQDAFEAEELELAHSWENLFYACSRCNRKKGAYWRDPGTSEDFIPNPCQHTMDDHVQLEQGGTVEVRSPAGKAMVDQLELNEPARLHFRSWVIEDANQFVDRHTEAKKVVDAWFAQGREPDLADDEWLDIET